MSPGSVIDLFVDSESYAQPPSARSGFRAANFGLYVAHTWRLSTLRSRHCARNNYDAWKPCAGWQGRACREQSEEWSLDLQPKDTKEQRCGCADPPLGSVGEWHECYVPRQSRRRLEYGIIKVGQDTEMIRRMACDTSVDSRRPSVGLWTNLFTCTLLPWDISHFTQSHLVRCTWHIPTK